MNKELKVVHISTYSYGGAGNAAYRIHEALMMNGIDSRFVCLHQSKNENLIATSVLYQLARKGSFLKKIVVKIKWRLKAHLDIIIGTKAIIDKKFNSIRRELKCEYASLPFSIYNILEDPIVQKADIIHLHWVAGMLDYPTFFRGNTKPVVWTLHDMNPFQGIFHYKEDEIRNASISSKLDFQVLAIKRKSINTSSQNLHIVCPSGWLLKSAMNSNSFKKVKGNSIPYPLNMEVFSPHTDPYLKERFNIPDQNTVFLFVAQNVFNHRKGFDMLIEALANIKRDQLTLLVIGEISKPDIPELDIRMLGTVEDNILLSEYYSVADAFIIASREDNLPNVMLESMACGTPVLSFNVGGMAEFIKDGFNGLKAEKKDADELVKIMNEFIKTKNTYNSDAIRNFALQNFSNHIIAEKYKEVYSSVLNS